MRLFVYGTLKDKLEKYPCLGQYETKFRYPLIKLGILFLLDVVNLGHYVQGKVFDIPIELISLIDEYEGTPNLYFRSIIEIKDLGECHTYFKSFVSEELLRLEFLKEY